MTCSKVLSVILPSDMLMIIHEEQASYQVLAQLPSATYSHDQGKSHGALQDLYTQNVM